MNESQPEMAFYSSAHLNQDWSSGDCNTFKKLKEHLRRYDTETEEEYIQPEDSFQNLFHTSYLRHGYKSHRTYCILYSVYSTPQSFENASKLNCYDGWAPDLPDDQPVRSKYNTNGVAYYSTTYGTRYQEQSGNYLYTWPCNINRLDISTDGTSANSHIKPTYQGAMPYPPCMKPDFWQEK